MRNKAVIIILSLCLAMCAVFWYQLQNIKVSQKNTSESPSKTGDSEIDDTLKSVDNVISKVRLESTLFRLPSGFDPFRTPARRVDKTQTTQAENKKVIPAEQLIAQIKLSGISWNSISPLAVINRKILKEGDVIPDSEVKIKDIQPASVIVTYQNREYTLQFR